MNLLKALNDFFVLVSAYSRPILKIILGNNVSMTKQFNVDFANGGGTRLTNVVPNKKRQISKT
jgi:hypothetical protein